jgi:hypothetical protein
VTTNSPGISGLRSGLRIGVGTTTGAGIFVVPGEAAAANSFGIGSVPPVTTALVTGLPSTNAPGAATDGPAMRATEPR